MESGDKIEVTFHTVAGKVELTLDDRVYPDRTCGQYEAGWWAFDANSNLNSDYFVSEEGIVYDYAMESDRWDKVVGVCPAFKKRYEEMEDKLNEFTTG